VTDSRWLDREATARYISARVDHLPRLIRAGKLPAPSLHLGARSPRWDRESLDALFGAKIATIDPDMVVQSSATPYFSMTYIHNSAKFPAVFRPLR
jgi:hypothetical protein